MKLPGILMYCVHWGKSNCTRPVLMSVLDSFLWKVPQRQREREREETGGAGKKKKKNTRKEKGGQTFQQIYQVRVDSWAKEV